MSKLFEKPISTSNLHTPDFDNLCTIFKQTFDGEGVFVPGALVSQLEKELCEYHDAKFCVAFSTGFWALVALVRLKSIPNKNEVIIPSLTYRRLADAVFWAGQTPVFVDIESRHLSICPEAVERAISSETALILAVHPIVNCCDVKRLLSISNASNVPVVFDAVESVHETIDSRRIGSFGVGEVFSLHASKLINGLEGGYVCTDDEHLRNSLLRFRNHGVTTENESDFPHGLNCTMNDGHAAFALAGLREVSQIVEHNKRIYEAYLCETRSMDGIQILKFDDSQQTSYKNVVAEVREEFPLDRDKLVELMNSEGILARAHYAPGLHSKTYEYPVTIADLKVSYHAVDRFVNLPCGYMVSVDDVVTTCGFLKSLTLQIQG